MHITKRVLLFAALLGVLAAWNAGEANPRKTRPALAEVTSMAGTIEDARAFVSKPRRGGSALIIEGNDASAGRLADGWTLSQLEGSGMTEPTSPGPSVWEGEVVEDGDGNRAYSGTWRDATGAEVDAWESGDPIFAD